MKGVKGILRFCDEGRSDLIEHFVVSHGVDRGPGHRGVVVDKMMKSGAFM